MPGSTGPAASSQSRKQREHLGVPLQLLIVLVSPLVLVHVHMRKNRSYRRRLRPTRLTITVGRRVAWMNQNLSVKTVDSNDPRAASSFQLDSAGLMEIAGAFVLAARAPSGGRARSVK